MGLKVITLKEISQIQKNKYNTIFVKGRKERKEE